MKKSVYRKAAETLANKTLRNTTYTSFTSNTSLTIADFSCNHIVYHSSEYDTKRHKFMDAFYADDPVATQYEGNWWNVKYKSKEQLLAASLALLFMEYLDEDLYRNS